jgi:hypothetical protein
VGVVGDGVSGGEKKESRTMKTESTEKQAARYAITTEFNQGTGRFPATFTATMTCKGRKTVWTATGGTREAAVAGVRRYIRDDIAAMIKVDPAPEAPKPRAYVAPWAAFEMKSEKKQTAPKGQAR